MATRGKPAGSGGPAAQPAAREPDLSRLSDAAPLGGHGLGADGYQQFILHRLTEMNRTLSDLKQCVGSLEGKADLQRAEMDKLGGQLDQSTRDARSDMVALQKDVNQVDKAMTRATGIFIGGAAVVTVVVGLFGWLINKGIDAAIQIRASAPVAEQAAAAGQPQQPARQPTKP